MKKQVLFLGIILFNFLNSTGINAQELPFKQVVKNTFPSLRGNLELVGNNIASINQLFNGRQYAPEDDFNEFAHNGNLVTQYIDIDTNSTTVSSSSADLILPSECSTIRYAGLYWSGTYFWNFRYYIDDDGDLTTNVTSTPAFLTEDGNFFTSTDTGIPYVVPNRRYGQTDDPITTDNAQALALPNPRTLNDANDFRYIKFAPPGQPYISITPTSAVPSTVLYDGFRGTATNTSNTSTTDVPYVGYADVTSILQGLEASGVNLSGTYTVGNVKCFTGRTDGGGTAGGWALVITYEDPNEPRRFISSFEGYALIRNGGTPVTYDYDGFNTIPTGPVNARFGIATLEGDEGFANDALEIQGDLQTNYTLLGDAVNPVDNFFNSSISKNGAYVTTRNPASRNTLGFDLDLFEIANPNNSVIANGETGATFRTSTGGQPGQTTGDTFGTFLNTFAIEVIEPDIRIVKRVQDRNGIPIPQGDGVRLGDELFYVLTIQNIGNDDAINTIIRDNMPTNTDFITGSVELPATGVTSSYDATNRQLVFDIDDSIVEISDAPFTIRFRVQVASGCEALRDACSSEITNTALASYEGQLSGIVVSEDASIFEVDECNNEGSTFSSVTIDLGTCAFDYEVTLCNGEAVLTAGDNYDSYTWRNSSTGEQVGTEQTIIVNQLGNYTVDCVSNDCRNSWETHEVIPLTTTGDNPLFNLVPQQIDNIVFCPIDGTVIPELFLCGDESRTLDITSSINNSSVVWQRLDSSSCDASPLATCPNTNTDCNWVTVGTGAVFTLNEPSQTFPVAGEYRISATFANTCTEYFYFNVYQNLLDAQLSKRDIICGQPGFVRVDNIPETGYEFSLDNVNFQTSNEFTGITTAGEVTVYIKQVFSAQNPVSCTFEERITVFEIENTEILTGFTLIDASNNIEIGELADESVIDLADLETAYLSFAAQTDNTFTDDIASVLLELEGPISATRRERVAPYTMFGDIPNLYFGKTLFPGNYTLTATPFTKNPEQCQGNARQIRFTIISGETLAVVAPNPIVNDELVVSFTKRTDPVTVSYRLSSPTGKKIKEGQLVIGSNKESLRFDVSSIIVDKGIYYLTIMAGERQQVLKVLKN